MPSVYDLKPRFQGLLRPGVGALASAGVTANQVTAAAVVLSFGVGLLLVLKRPDPRWLLMLPAALFLRMALNAVDGMLAREHAMKSSLGAVLNELGDVLSDTALYAPLALWPGFPPRLVAAAVVLAVVSELAGVVAVQIGTHRRYDGPMGKSDRAFVIGALGLALGLGAPPGPWLSVVWGAMTPLLCLTIWNRAYRAVKASPA